MKSTISYVLLSLCAASLTDLSGTESVVDSLTNMVDSSNPLKSELDQLDNLEAPVKESNVDLPDEVETIFIKEVELETPNTSELNVKPEKASYGEESDYSTDDEGNDKYYNGKYTNKKGGLKHHKGKMSYGGDKDHYKGKHYKKGFASESDFDSGSDSGSDSESEDVFYGGYSGKSKNVKIDRLYKRSDWKKKPSYDDWSDGYYSSDDDMSKDHKYGLKDYRGSHMDHKDVYESDNGQGNAHWGERKGYGSGMDGYGGGKSPWDGHMGHKEGYGEDDHWDGHKDYVTDVDGYGGKKLYRRDYYNNGQWNSSPRNYRRNYYAEPQYNMGFRNYRRNYYDARSNWSPNYNY